MKRFYRYIKMKNLKVPLQRDIPYEEDKAKEEKKSKEEKPLTPRTIARVRLMLDKEAQEQSGGARASGFNAMRDGVKRGTSSVLENS
jgi:hypothetical protein